MYWIDFEEIKMCVAYKLDGKLINYFPSSKRDQVKVQPVYKKFKGWKSSTSGIKNFDDLPIEAKNYIQELEKILKLKFLVFQQVQREKIQFY